MMRNRLLVVAMVALWAWTVPVVQTMPIDADGPSGLSDNADFDDLIVSLTSPTLAVAPTLVAAAFGAVFVCLATVPLVAPCALSQADPRSAGIRAPPLA
jgi:hypothetical protein